MLQKPKGTADILTPEVNSWQAVEEILRMMCQVYNVHEIRTPIFERTELFSRSAGDHSDVVSKEMYTFEDKNKRSMTLRPEGTAGIVRSIVENKLYASSEGLQRFYYMGPMFRYEQPQKGRYRQFHQFGVEMVGLESPYVDVEAISLAVTISKAIGIEDFTLRINTLGDDQSRSTYKEALIAYLKPHIKEFCPDCQERFKKNPLRILDCKIDMKQDAMMDVPEMQDYLSKEAQDHFQQVTSLLSNLDIDFMIDPRIVRGLDYYNHTVFEITINENGLGKGATLCGGGRYNNLVKELGGPDYPGVGFAFGMERLLLASNPSGMTIDNQIDVYVMPIGEEAKIKALQIVTELRANGYVVDTDYQNRSLKSQFKSVDRYKASYAVIMGDEEVKGNYVMIKDTKSKEQQKIAMDQIIAYLDEKEGFDHE